MESLRNEKRQPAKLVLLKILSGSGDWSDDAHWTPQSSYSHAMKPISTHLFLAT